MLWHTCTVYCFTLQESSNATFWTVISYQSKFLMCPECTSTHSISFIYLLKTKCVWALSQKGTFISDFSAIEQDCFQKYSKLWSKQEQKYSRLWSKQERNDPKLNLYNCLKDLLTSCKGCYYKVRYCMNYKINFRSFLLTLVRASVW